MKKFVYLIAPLMCFSTLVGCNKPTYTVTWKNWDGSILEIDENVKDGSVPEYNGETPIKHTDDVFYVYKFIGWNHELKEVHSDIEYIASFSDSETEVDPVVSEINVNVTADSTISFEIYQYDSLDYVIDWGDGNVTTNEKTHTYSDAGERTIMISSVLSFESRMNSYIESIRFGEAVTRLFSSSFQMCTNLKWVSISNEIQIIENNPFYQCDSLQYTNYKDGIYLGNESNPYLAIIKYPYYIETSAPEINPQCKVIAGSAFYQHDHITKVDIPDGVRFIGRMAFSKCELLDSVNISDSVFYIDMGAFSECKLISSIIMPKKLTYIDSIAFASEGPSLKLVDLTKVEIIPEVDGTSFGENHPDDFKILVPKGRLKEYQNHPRWRPFKDYMLEG